MNDNRRLRMILALMFLIIFSLSCRTLMPEPTPTPIPPTHTFTPSPPTTTPTPPTITPSRMPPTATPTFIPPTATPTSPPPTPTPTPMSLGALLIGSWVAEVDGGELIYFTFNDGEITISFMDEIFVEGRYTADFSFDPGHVDLMFEDEEDVYMIVEFLNENTIRMDGGDTPGDRPRTFGNDTLKLVRVRESD